ncbi:MAG TPA: hypothetical protein V6C65_12215 [Allocoleopsis sp.]
MIDSRLEAPPYSDHERIDIPDPDRPPLDSLYWFTTSFHSAEAMEAIARSHQR